MIYKWSNDVVYYLHIEISGKVAIYIWTYFCKLFIYNYVKEKVVLYNKTCLGLFII